MLSIKGHLDKANETKDNKDHFISRERIESSFERTVNLGYQGIDISKIKADLSNGVLSLTIPKESSEVNAKKIEIA